jgi:benzoate membrane transport protein
MTIPLTAAQVLGLSQAETSSWIMALYGLAALLSLILTVIYRQPLLLTGNIFFVIFINGLEGQLSYPELTGASIIAGVAVMLIGILGLTKRLASWIPFPIMFGLLAGAVLPFVLNIFNTLGEAPLLIASTFLVYLLSSRFFGTHLPPILPALISGLVLAAVTGQFDKMPEQLTLAFPKLTMPIFSLQAIITATPVLFVLITLQGNLPAVRFLQSQGYEPPNLVISLVSGIGTMLGSFLGPTGISLSLPATSIVAGSEAGEHNIRHISVYFVGGAALLIGLLAGIAVDLAVIIPYVLLLSLAGVSVVDVLGNALRGITEGPLFLGPLFSFVVAASNINFLGFGPFFWSPVIGTGVSFLLERDELRKLHNGKDN